VVHHTCDAALTEILWKYQTSHCFSAGCKMCLCFMFDGNLLDDGSMPFSSDIIAARCFASYAWNTDSRQSKLSSFWFVMNDDFALQNWVGTTPGWNLCGSWTQTFVAILLSQSHEETLKYTSHYQLTLLKSCLIKTDVSVELDICERAWLLLTIFLELPANETLSIKENQPDFNIDHFCTASYRFHK